MAWLFLPENEQVQYLQKIALRAENLSGSKLFFALRIERINQIICLAEQNDLLVKESFYFSILEKFLNFSDL